MKIPSANLDQILKNKTMRNADHLQTNNKELNK